MSEVITMANSEIADDKEIVFKPFEFLNSSIGKSTINSVEK